MNLGDLWDAPAQKIEYNIYKPIFVPILENTIAKQTKRVYPKSEEPAFRASGLGSCPRLTLYKLRGVVEEEYEAKSAITLDMGTAVHEILQNYLTKDGLLDSLEETVSTEEVVNTTGHYDGVITIDNKRYLIEFKTTNVEAYQRLATKPIPWKKHQQQATFYMKALGVDVCLFVYINRNLALLSDFEKANPDVNPVFLEVPFKYDPKLLEKNAEENQALTNHFYAGTLPKYERNSTCDYCPSETKERCKIDRKLEKAAEKAKAKLE
jgi:hypothetical protein